MPRNAWKNEFYVTIYQCAKEGMTLTETARVLGVEKRTLRSWRDNNPAVADAIRRGRSSTLPDGKAGETFIDYVYDRLPQDLKDVWDQLTAWESEPNGEKKMEALLERQGKNARQALFIHAVVASNFNMAEACRKTFVTQSTYEKWAREDENFVRLLKALSWHQDNFIEASMFKLIKGGSEAATIAAAKSRLRDRGFDVKTTVEHKGIVGQAHFDLQAVLGKVSVQARREFLAVMRGQEPPQPIEAIPDRPAVRVVVNSNEDTHDE